MNQDVYEREIDLKDLFFSLLFQWRKILQITVLAAIVITALLCLKTFISPQEDANGRTYEKSMKIYKREEKAIKTNIKRMEKSLALQNAYMSEADLMKINPYQKPQFASQVLFTIKDSKSGRRLNALLDMYQYQLSAGEYLADIAKQQDIKLRYLKKQLSFSQKNYSTDSSGMSVTVNQNQDSVWQGVLYINVTASSLEKAEEIYQEIVRELQRINEKATAEYGEHSYKILQETSGEVVDTALLDEQQGAQNHITELNTSLTAAEVQLDALVEPDISAMGGSLSAKKVIKYLILGILGGGVLAVFWLAIRYILRDTVVSEEQIKQYFAVQGLGTFQKNSEKQSSAALDRWISRWAYGKVRLSEEDVFDMIALNVQNFSDQQTGNQQPANRKILLSGMVAKERMEEIAEKLGERLPEYSFQTQENVLYHTSARKAMADGQTVILVEEVHGTRCVDLQQEVKVMTDLQAEILGVILV